MASPVALDIAAIAGQHRLGDTGAVDLGEQPRGEGELVGFTRQRQGFEYAERQERGQVVSCGSASERVR